MALTLKTVATKLVSYIEKLALIVALFLKTVLTKLVPYVETHDRLFSAISSIVIAIFTIVLAISTIYLCKSTAGLEKFAEQQASEMKESIAAAKDAVKAASDANRLNRDNFLATERPWIAADIEVGGPLRYDVNGANITLRFQLKNVGHSPATHLWIRPQGLALPFGIDNFDPRAIQQKIYTEMKTRPLSPWGITLFPGDTIVENMTMSIGAEELKRSTQIVDFIEPTIVGTIDYSFVFEDGHHQTGFVVELRRSDTPRPESTAKKRSPAAIFPDEGDIPATELRLYRSFLGNEYAD